jgi:hypothetical protein
MRDVLFDAWTLPARGWLGVRVEYGREYVGSTCARMRACLSGHARFFGDSASILLARAFVSVCFWLWVHVAWRVVVTVRV